MKWTPSPFHFFSMKPSAEHPLWAAGHCHRLVFPACQSSRKRLALHPTSPPSTSYLNRPPDRRFPFQISISYYHSISLTTEWSAYLIPLNPLVL
jgi:hypothetical protein